MKTIVAVISPHKLDEVQEALHDLGVQGMTVSEAKGFGRQRGHTEIYRGAEYDITFVPKIRVEVVCDDERVEELIKGITTAGRSGNIGDGKVWVLPVEQLVRIRTGEKGDDAL